MLISEHAGGGLPQLLPTSDQQTTSLNSPAWSTILSNYQRYGAPQRVSLPSFQSLPSHWQALGFLDMPGVL